MKVHEIMTGHARSVAPDTPLIEVAGLMRELDVGALPVCDGDTIAGIVTDRDMIVRGLAYGVDPRTTRVSEVMSGGIVAIAPDDDVELAARMMEQHQIRRLPVINAERRLIGMVSLGDIATSSNPAFSGMALRDVSAPNHPSARQRRLEQQSEPAMPPGVGGRRGPAGGGRSRMSRAGSGAVGGSRQRSRSAAERGAGRDGASEERATPRAGNSRRRRGAVGRSGASARKSSGARSRKNAAKTRASEGASLGANRRGKKASGR